MFLLMAGLIGVVAGVGLTLLHSVVMVVKQQNDASFRLDIRKIPWRGAGMLGVIYLSLFALILTDRRGPGGDLMGYDTVALIALAAPVGALPVVILWAVIAAYNWGRADTREAS